MIDQIVQTAHKLLPMYLADPADRRINNGNVSICIIDKNGQVYGAMWGNDKVTLRYIFQTAWRKASQVWITGIATGKYEELVYTNKIDWAKYGIMKPDLIGWEGGWPVTLAGGIHLAVAVSGMRGEKDTDLVVKAVTAVGGTANQIQQ
ncbi:MAG: heme-binding protein [Kiritimatiellia bacterium]|nr:heme-binding protein [Kiritimatiellia bacterium]